MRAPLVFFVAATGLLGQTWMSQTSGTESSLRGVSVVTANVVWSSGTDGVWLRTVDGGASWQYGRVQGAEAFDFRGVHGIDERTAYLMSSGPGEKSRIYKTTDGGAHWNLLLTNPDAKGFFDAIAFWDSTHGIILGDPVDGRAVVLTTEDGGRHWTRRRTPAALPNESAFAASNSCLVVRGKEEVWFATGGLDAGRVLRSTNGGVSWTVSTTPIRKDSASAGIFSLAFSDGLHGFAVGGDYTHPQETEGNIAFTSDGGATWTARKGGAVPHGYRSTVAYLADKQWWLLSGTSGSDISLDGGNTWTLLDQGAINAIGAISSQAAWAVGPKGRIAKLDVK